jgi:hypothetical protein
MSLICGSSSAELSATSVRSIISGCEVQLQQVRVLGASAKGPSGNGSDEGSSGVRCVHCCCYVYMSAASRTTSMMCRVGDLIAVLV